jgi:hypothetical protein
VGWLPWFMERLGEHYESRGDWIPGGWSKPPAEYVAAGNVVVTCEPDESSVPYVVEMLGDECIMFASDYPHWDGAWPHSSSELFEHNQGGCPTRVDGPGGRGQRPSVLRPAVGSERPFPERLGPGAGQRHPLDLERPSCATSDPTRSAPTPGCRASEPPRRPWRHWRHRRPAVDGSTARDGCRPTPGRGCEARGWTRTVTRIVLRTVTLSRSGARFL